MNYVTRSQSKRQRSCKRGRNRAFLYSVNCLSFSLWLGWATIAQADNSELGAALYQASCSACHGADASGVEELNSPSLAGQSADYIVRQLQHFSSGVRGGAGSDPSAMQMRAISQSVSTDQNRHALAQYLSGLDTQPVTPAAGDKELGYKLYQASCGTCHGSAADGNDLLYSPKLSGLSESYLKRQYQQFLTGERGGNDADKYARQMKMMAATLSDPAQIDAVVAYLTSLEP